MQLSTLYPWIVSLIIHVSFRFCTSTCLLTPNSNSTLSKGVYFSTPSHSCSPRNCIKPLPIPSCHSTTPPSHITNQSTLLRRQLACSSSQSLRLNITA
ncbi:Uncharacterized protein HZ326_16810 [Fusarium oxysporum f. sp. albedinis]|nr:Uncharacterized protein HZ326_16810 [Fusarium oxysporum f. sp. albedinis]